MQKILIIRFSSLGDLVLTTPIFREIKRVFPDSSVSVLTSNDHGLILKNNSHIDRLILHKRKDSFEQLKILIKKLGNERFDLIYDAHRSLRSMWIVWNLTRYGLSKVPKVWSIKKRSLRKSLLIHFKFNLLKKSPSQRTHLLRPLQDHTNLVLKDHTELFPVKSTTFLVKRFMKKNGLFSKEFIAIGPSSSYYLKCWPVSHFHELISGLLKKNWPLVLVGGKNEIETLQIEKKFLGKLQNVAGQFSPLESAEILKQAWRTVTNDTSISHLSEAMGTPTIVFFGPTVKEFGYAPFLKESIILETNEILKCRPCSRDGRGSCHNPVNLKCLKTISPDFVLSLIPNMDTIQKK